MSNFTPPSPEDLNEYFDSYEIDSLIAQGGMGAVYLGKQLSLDREVAIKILPPELSEDDAYLASFQSEAKSLAKLNHPNLVGIFDFGQVKGMFYIIMEHVPGRSLFYTAHRQAVDELEAASLISEICKGLSHAHQHDILHRDIKPANILIDDHARPKLVDFGLAKPMSDDDHAGVTFGTPGYTAPEVVANPNQVDHRSDIFSVGVMLYELLTGEMPGDPLTPASELTDTDPRFDKIINKSLHPLTTLRYNSCEEMAQKIDSLLESIQEETKETQEQNKTTSIFATPTATTDAPEGIASILKTVAPQQPQAKPQPRQNSLPKGFNPVKKKSNASKIIILTLLALILITSIALQSKLARQAEHKKQDAPTKNEQTQRR